MKNVHVGTSGFYYKHWLTDFYPTGIKRGTLLSYYANHFSTVEINSSFYTLLKETTVNSWVKTVPADFVFTFKVSRYITHMKKLIYDEEAFKNFFQPLQILADQKAKQIVVFQTAASLHCNTERLETIFEKIPKGFRYAFEFRSPTWFTEDVYKILKKNNAALILSDSPEKDDDRLWPLKDIETTDFFYIRFHGSKSLFSSSYTDEELSDYANLIKKKVKKGIEVFCYFNNDIGGHAIRNAKKLKELLTLN
ncbi:MAG TPA: DUF72 domain-containing protein [Candidatus Nitrosocosmicus sp.]|nr:DUF72 domain-containing protein [Candidatus Nitrosocosmicus sp.]